MKIVKRGKQVRLKIRGQIIFYFSVLLSIPMIILGVFSYHEAMNHSERLSIIAMENSLSNLISEMNARSERETEYIKYLAYNLNFRKILEADSIDRVKLALELNNSVEPILWYYITSDNYVKGIDIITEKLDTGLGSFMKPSLQFSDELWYEESFATKANMWHTHDGELFITRQILDTAVAENIATMRINLFASSFLAAFDEFQYLDNGILVLDKDGTIVYKRGTKRESVNEQAEEAIRAGVLSDTDSYLMRHAMIESSEWEVFYYVDRSLISGQLCSILRRTLQVVSIVLVLAVVVISLFSRRLSYRILVLRDFEERVASGDLDASLETEDTDEIGIVMNSLSTMTNRLDLMIHEIYKMQAEKRATELQALQAQINPHFLYNVLSSIKWKALQNGDESISDIAGLIATFYRTSLNNGRVITTVKNELSNIKAYIEIQRHMHDFEFSVEYNIAQEALDYQMLNYLLQPIVENAFKHGIDYTDESRNGQLVIQCYLDEEHIIFEIKNNGPQIEREKTRQALHTPGKRYGLYNVQERIELYYSESCGINADIDNNGFTVFTVRIGKKITNLDDHNIEK